VTTPTRPVLRWHGGKWMLAPWIIDHFPPHRVYTEAFGGAASVLMRKPRTYSEVYNDLDGEVVNLFRVLQQPLLAARLRELLTLTPFARGEFNLAYEPSEDPVERARRLVVVSFMGFGSNAHNTGARTGFRAKSSRSGTTPAHDWSHYPDCMEAVVERLRGVVVENLPALEIIEKHDSPETLHYVDPPYVHSTRKKWQQRNYRHEMTDKDHHELAALLHRVRGGGGPQRLRLPALRPRSLPGLAPHREAGSRRWGSGTNRGSVDQRGGAAQQRGALLGG
jgi:DNA adenine methylase